MMLYRHVSPFLRFLRSRSGTYLFTVLLLVVLLSVFSLTVLTFSSRTGSALYNGVIQHSNSREHAPHYFLSSSRRSFPKQKVLLVGYMRSGSTLTGDILQAHPRVFYVYEPLLYLWDHYIPGREPPYEKNLRRRMKSEFHQYIVDKHIPKPSEFLESMFSCNLTTANFRLLTNVRHSKAFRNKDCSVDKTKFYGVDSRKLEKCGQVLRDTCSAGHTIVQKTVRMSMAELDSMLAKDPNLRVIHLLRDPRGSLLSRMHFTAKDSGEMHKNITALCLRLTKDVQASQFLSEKYWGRILTVRYEDLSQRPESVSAMMYRFTGLEFLPSVQAYLKLITNTEKLDKRGNPLKKSTARKDPFVTAYHWRKELSYDMVLKSDRHCGEVYKTMGYVKFPSEEQLRDLSIPAKLEEFGDGLMTVC